MKNHQPQHLQNKNTEDLEPQPKAWMKIRPPSTLIGSKIIFEEVNYNV